MNAGYPSPDRDVWRRTPADPNNPASSMTSITSTTNNNNTNATSSPNINNINNNNNNYTTSNSNLPTFNGSAREYDTKYGQSTDAGTAAAVGAAEGSAKRVSMSPDASQLSLAAGGAQTPVCGDFTLRCVMVGLGMVDWMKAQWMLWSIFGSILLAYRFPSPVDSDGVVAQALVLITFTLTGAAAPAFQKNTAALKYVIPTILVLLFSLLVSPVIATLAFVLSSSRKEDLANTSLLFAGMLCTFCLPPSTVLSVVSTKSALGNEALSNYLGSIGNVTGVLITPMLISLLMTTLDAGKPPSASRLALFPVIAILPFLLGYSAQYVFQWITERAQRNEAAKKRLMSVQNACNEICDTGVRNWRKRANQLNFAAVLLLNYVIFSSLFEQSASNSDNDEGHKRGANAKASFTYVTWQGIGDVVVIVVAAHVVLCILGWVSSSIAVDSPEDRIALFYGLVQKSEVLAVPTLTYLFRGEPGAPVLMVAPIVYHLTQTVSSGLLSVVLRQWRNRFNCKPGTTLLPLRLSKQSRA